MEEYYCEDCKYHSKQLYNFKRHLKSQQHTKSINSTNSTNSIESAGSVGSNQINKNVILECEYEKFKRKIFCCDFCNNVYITKRSLLRHLENCKTMRNSELLEAKIIELTNELKNERDDHKKQLNKALDVARVNSKTANTSMNILKYAKMYLNNVEPLSELNMNGVLNAIKYKNSKGIEAKNEAYVKIAIHKFNHGVFVNFIGDMIINCHKPKTKREANVIATDTSRLCFIIMQKVKKDRMEQNEWINDKSGKKFTELVLKPIINAVKETLIEFIEFKKTKELNENSLCLMGKCVELKRDIEVDKFTKQILRYVAPSFHFDTLKLLDDDIAEHANNLVKIKKNKI